MLSTTDRPGNVSAGGTTVGTKHTVVSAVESPVVRWVLSKPALGGTVTSTATVRAAIRVGAGAFVPVTFDGQPETSFPITASGEVVIIESDPIPVTIPAGSEVTVNVWGNSDTGGAVQVSPNTWISGVDPGYILGGQATVVDSTYSTGLLKPSMRPAAILGPGTFPSWVLTGDSITMTSNSHLERWARGTVRAAVKSAMGGEGWYHYPAVFNQRLGQVLPFGTHVLSAMGVNDVNTSAATAMQNAVSYWQQIRSFDEIEQLIACTITPCFVSSTDGFTTLEGQTPATNNRPEVNAWLRDGAPLLSGVPSPGSTDPATVRIGQAGHPVDLLADTSSVIQDADDTGRFRVDVGPLGGDGTHFNSAAHDLISGYLASILP
ncbi:SGNH/GDSL hydrolase family protein [Microbacterium esteraromaticum]|uniref:SGNH/GDSL hydrolase family protein n=1 Tax=Microbacterium esteraromaticum TaxID=57043 RepID=UPI0023674C49|nr:SGNH/GDSL hydrolase family protein [Microbacterium esteraromaticum]WDH77939.1 SGNH/GDSL hydrolase family protein [Microbacterium esteraromaticum]WDH80208.1 SGNH/GDSL hydrolase family protein [Microbacterium esteraromaticum]